MAEYTTNYNLRKPGQEDFYNVEDFNSNADIVDGALKGIKEDLNTHAANQTNPHKVTAAQVGASNPNLLINGDFQIWQRGTSFEQFANIWVYTADRWRLGGVSDGIIRTISKSNDGSLQVVNKTGGGIGYVNISQPLEISEEWKNKSYTFSVRLKAEDPTLVYLKAKMNGEERETAIVPTNVYDTYSLNFQAPDNLTSLEVMIYVTTPVTKINIKYVKLEAGSVATPFVPRSYAEELSECQRYYKPLLKTYFLSYAQGVSGNWYGAFQMDTNNMRVTPSVVFKMPVGSEAFSNIYKISTGRNVLAAEFKVTAVGSDGRLAFTSTTANVTTDIAIKGLAGSYADAEIY